MKSRRVFEKIKIITKFETDAYFFFRISIMRSRMGFIRYQACSSPV